MGILLKILGALWALIGVWGLTFVNWSAPEPGGIVIGVMFHTLLFIFPGLALYGIGAGVRSTKSNA